MSSNTESKPEESETSVSEEREKYPKSVLLILGNQLCERFSFYGLRAVLTLYLTYELLYSHRTATMIYHSFMTVAYFTPVLGAIMADSWLGKYHTVAYVSIWYVVGNITLSIGAIPMEHTTMKIISLVGLFVTGVGTGGIKPCVVAFGGDQFSETQLKERKQFFSIIYFCMNFGSLCSTFLTPILRDDVQCFGEKSCFSLAFGVPAVLMVVALVLFVVGKPFYTLYPAEGSEFVAVFQCIGHALYRKVKGRGEKKDHWLDYADDKFTVNKIQEVKSLLRVCFIFIPLPVFWALYDQLGSKWVLQAAAMDGYVLGYYIKPDQMQIVNPFVVLIMIPLFEKVVYPVLSKLHLLKRPLQRITTGGLFTAIAFVLAGFIQINIERGVPVIPEKGFSELTVINNSPCEIIVTGSHSENFTLSFFQGKILKYLHLGEEKYWQFSPSGCSANRSKLQKFNISGQIESMMITLDNEDFKIYKGIDTKEKSRTGVPKFRIFFATEFNFAVNEDSAFKLEGSQTVYATVDDSTRPTTQGMTEYVETKPGEYKIYLPSNRSSYEDKPIGSVYLKSGGSYIIAIYQNLTDQQAHVFHFAMVEPHALSVLLQLVPILLVTAGEIMFSITGLSFSYSQAAPSMKSVVQAAWLLTTAVGNVLVVFISNMNLVKKQSSEFFMYAVIMTLDMLVFGIMAYYYKYVGSEASPVPSETGSDNK